MKQKPVVRYYTNEIMGTKLTYKQTLITTIKGPLAKIFLEANSNGKELTWSYDHEHHKIDIYRSELLDPVRYQEELEKSKLNI